MFKPNDYSLDDFRVEMIDDFLFAAETEGHRFGVSWAGIQTVNSINRDDLRFAERLYEATKLGKVVPIVDTNNADTEDEDNIIGYVDFNSYDHADALFTQQFPEYYDQIKIGNYCAEHSVLWFQFCFACRILYTPDSLTTNK